MEATVIWPEHLKGRKVQIQNSPAAGVYNCVFKDTGAAHVFNADNLDMTGGYDYRAAELANVDPTGEFPPKLKISSDGGATKWLTLTPTEFDQVKAVLLDYRNR